MLTFASSFLVSQLISTFISSFQLKFFHLRIPFFKAVLIKTCAPLYHLHLNCHILITQKLMLSLLNYLSKFPLELTGNSFSSELCPRVNIMITLQTLHKISNFFSLLKYIKVPRFKSYFKSRSLCSYCMLSINFLYCNLH